MKTLTLFIVASILATGFVGNSYAHKSEIVGDYKLEIGWMNEPPIAGIDNAIELVVTVATEFEKEQAESHEEESMEHSEHEEESMEHSEHEEGEGVRGLEEDLELLVVLDGQEFSLMIKESDFPGVYHAEFMPSITGFSIVRISGTIGDEKIKDFDMHPEEIEPLSTLAPLHQIKHGIGVADVECKEGLVLYMKTFDETPVCTSSTTSEELLKRGWLSLF